MFWAAIFGDDRQQVYFVQSGESGPIKVGISECPKKRLSGMQTGSAEKLRLLGTIPGGAHAEGFLHDTFREYHIRGEWFRPHPALIAIVNDLIGAPR